MLKIVSKRKLNYAYKNESEICVYDKIQNPNGIYLFKVNNKSITYLKVNNEDTRMMSWSGSLDFIGNFEHNDFIGNCEHI